MAPLADYARRLRERSFGKVPDFDPLDGGVRAQALFLFEKPGPKAFASGFISRNNNDKTAENTFNFMVAAGIPRELTCIWNTIPSWNGTIKVTEQEVAVRLATLGELLDQLPELRVAVLVGRRAERAREMMERRDIPTIASAHPSPRNFALAREKWCAIPKEWSKAAAVLAV